MVENLTLSKMGFSLIGLTEEQTFGLPTVLMRSYSENHNSLIPSQTDVSLRLEVQYQINGHTLTPKTHVFFQHQGKFECCICQKQVKKLFDGYCFSCLQSSAQADRCVLNPVGCHYMAGTCREPDWGQEFCYQPHFVYLAFTDKLKVGITRKSQIPTRWIDQGATMAVLLAEVGSRHQAGLLEEFLSQTYASRSHWMKMLKTANDRPSLQEFSAERAEALKSLSLVLENRIEFIRGIRAPMPDFAQDASRVELLPQALVAEIQFPLWNALPEKIVSMNLDKNPKLDSSVLGIKGQYLFLESGVFNVRRHEGYVVCCDVRTVSDPDCARQ